jgi:hypothetical protein
MEDVENMDYPRERPRIDQDDGIQVTIVQSQTTEDSWNTLDKGYHLNPN